MPAPSRPVLRYHGGKWRLAPWIVEQFPAHRAYVEPYAGGASVLLQKPRSHTEVYNDLWDEVVNVFRILRDPRQAERLRVMCYLTPFSRTEMIESDQMAPDPLERARRLIYRSFSGFGSASANSLHKTGFRSNSRDSGAAPSSDWANWPSHIPAFVERLRGVTIENRPALEVIQQFDREDTLIYVDPPYVWDVRRARRRNTAYQHEMNDDDHRELAEVLKSCKGMVVISGYVSDLYDEIYSDWLRRDRVSYADGASKRVESVWLNDAAFCGNKSQLTIFEGEYHE